MIVNADKMGPASRFQRSTAITGIGKLLRQTKLVNCRN